MKLTHPPPKLFRPARFGKNRCFLCGKRLCDSNRSDEHVFPKWVLKKFDLWDEKLILLNGSTIPYRKLTIPCCTKCNTHFLKNLESKVCKAVSQGFSAVRRLDDWTLFAWTGKILYGLLYKELFLKADQRQSGKSPIINRQFLEQFRMHHLFLQGIRIPIQFSGFFPATILVFRTQSPSNPTLQWDFRDSPISLFVSIRMGKVGIISVLQDGGTTSGSRDSILSLKSMSLHPIQFRELSAVMHYRSLLLNRVPKFIIADGNPAQVFMSPLQGLSSKPIFDTWKYDQFANILSSYIGVEIEKIFYPPDRVMTWLYNPDHSIKKLNFKIQPWP